MLELIFALGASICYGTWNAISKKNIQDNGLYNAITYSYVGMVILLIAGAFITHQSFSFPSQLFLPYVAEVTIGAIAILALYKAFENGKASLLSPLSNFYILIVLGISVALLGEAPTTIQIIGSVIIVFSSIVLAFKDFKHLKVESGVLFIIVTILGWGYYYSFIKTFIPVWGPYMTNLYLELGITVILLLNDIVTRRTITIPKISKSGFVVINVFLITMGSFLTAYSVGMVGAALTSAVLASGSIFTDIVSYFLLKEKLQPIKYASIVIMILGLVLVLLG